jgi:hypothetical protein
MADTNTPALPAPDDPSKWETAIVGGTTVQDRRRQHLLAEGDAAAFKGPFDPRLPYELALEMDTPEATFAKHGYTPDEAAVLLGRKDFVLTLKRYRDEIVASGTGFKLKAKVQAEALLADSYQIATDPEAPPSVRADLIKWTAAVAGFGPPKEQAKEGGGGTAERGFALNITFTGSAPVGMTATAIDVTPTRVEES